MFGRGRYRGRRATVRAVHCVRHDVDLAAIRRFVDDGRPHGDRVTVEAIAWGECPACVPRYVAGFAGDEESSRSDRAAALAMLPWPPARAGGRFRCRCCLTAWDLDGSGWSAAAGSGLQAPGSPKALRAGERIEHTCCIVEAIDPAGIERALHGAFAEFDARSGRLVRDDLVDDLAESMLAAYHRKADERAEMARIATEHGLDDDLVESWRKVALDALALVRRLTSELALPSPEAPGRATPHRETPG